MERAFKGTLTTFDRALVKKTFEEYLLPFCGGGTIIQRCKRVWSKYQPLEGTFQALYQVDFADPKKGHHFNRQLYMIIPGESRMAPGMPEKGEPEEGASSGGCDLPVSYLYLQPLKMLIEVFPTDMRLPQLRTLVDPTTILPYLQAYSDLNKMDIPRITVLKYKPEKRCVIRYDLSGHVDKSRSIRKLSLIGKTFCDDRGRETFQIMRFLRRSGLPVPEPFSYIPELKLLLSEALQGRELESLVEEPDFPVYVKGAAKTVAELHTVTVDPKIVETVSLEEEADSFARLVERFQQECPPLKKKITRLASTIFRKLKNCRGEPLTFVHGELDPSQLIVHDSKIWVVDFDFSKVSHPATDVGRFLAYLNRLSLKLYGDPGRLGRMEKLFLEEYLSRYPCDVRTLILIWQAIECLKISFIHFRSQKSAWKFRLSGMWEIAEKVLSSV